MHSHEKGAGDKFHSFESFSKMSKAAQDSIKKVKVSVDRLNTIEAMAPLTKLMGSIEISKLEFHTQLLFIDAGQKMNNSLLTCQNQQTINIQFEKAYRDLTSVWI
jgi:hypothetical protein